MPDVLLIKYHWCIICCMANQWKEPVELIIGIVNHEYQVLSYRIDIMIDGIENKEIATEELAHQKKVGEGS